jgi:predicted RNase H-like nuclease (RuvC/YqgF family)
LNVISIEYGKKLRKIKRLQKTIETYNGIIKLKQNYLNMLQRYKKYSNINKQCHETQDDINRFEFELGMFSSTLEKLKKELE